MTELLVLPGVANCWNQIGIRGDRSCPELAKVVHCHNCQVFANAGRQFLDAPSPEGYLEEWTQRLAVPLEISSTDLFGALVFRLGEEWLALSVQMLVEVTTPRQTHRIPHRRGALAGVVNIRGELHLRVHLDQVLGLQSAGPAFCSVTRSGKSLDRLLVIQRDRDRWVFAVDEVDQVQRFSRNDLTPTPATVSRALARLTQGVFHVQGRSVGLLDEEKLFHTLKVRIGENRR